MLPGGRKCIHNPPGASKTPPEAIFERMKYVSDDCADPPTMKLAMPPAPNSLHENHEF